MLEQLQYSYIYERLFPDMFVAIAIAKFKKSKDEAREDFSDCISRDRLDKRKDKPIRPETALIYSVLLIHL